MMMQFEEQIFFNTHVQTADEVVARLQSKVWGRNDTLSSTTKALRDHVAALSAMSDLCLQPPGLGGLGFVAMLDLKSPQEVLQQIPTDDLLGVICQMLLHLKVVRTLVALHSEQTLEFEGGSGSNTVESSIPKLLDAYSTCAGQALQQITTFSTCAPPKQLLAPHLQYDAVSAWEEIRNPFPEGTVEEGRKSSRSSKPPPSHGSRSRLLPRRSGGGRSTLSARSAGGGRSSGEEDSLPQPGRQRRRRGASLSGRSTPLEDEAEGASLGEAAVMAAQQERQAELDLELAAASSLVSRCLFLYNYPMIDGLSKLICSVLLMKV